MGQAIIARRPVRTSGGGSRRSQYRRGSVIVLSLGVVIVVATLGASMMVRSLNEHQLGQRYAVREEALYLAEAALDQASFNLRTPTDPLDDVLTGTLPTGTFQIESPVTQLGPTLWQVTTRGTSGPDQRRVEGVFQLTPQSVFQFALFGSQQVNVSGNAITDSYDSSLGPYNNDPNSPGYNAAHNGDVGTNGTNTGGVTVGGSIFVDGQMAVGPGVADPVSVVSGYDPAFITGGTSPPSDTQDVVAQSSTFPMPPVAPPLGMACSDFTVTGNTTVTLDTDVCYSSLTIQGGGVLTTNGVAVKVYLTGALIARGNSTVGYAPDPSKMLFLMSSSGQATLEEGTITGSTSFYGALYGPQATINIQGNAEVFGSIIANQVNLTGSAVIHYDERLSDVTTMPNVYRRTLISWREL